MHVNSEELVLRKDKTRIEIGPNFILTISSIRILMQMSLNISLGAKLSSAGFVVNQTMTTNYLKQTLIAKKKVRNQYFTSLNKAEMSIEYV